MSTAPGCLLAFCTKVELPRQTVTVTATPGPVLPSSWGPDHRGPVVAGVPRRADGAHRDR